MSPAVSKGKQAAAKAVVVALDVSEGLARALRVRAALNDLSPQDQMRGMIDLPFSRPQRPRLNLSLSEADCRSLGERYSLDPLDRIEIKRAVMRELKMELGSDKEG